MEICGGNFFLVPGSHSFGSDSLLGLLEARTYCYHFDLAALHLIGHPKVDAGINCEVCLWLHIAHDWNFDLSRFARVNRQYKVFTNALLGGRGEQFVINHHRIKCRLAVNELQRTSRICQRYIIDDNISWSFDFNVSSKLCTRFHRTEIYGLRCIHEIGTDFTVDWNKD